MLIFRLFHIAFSFLSVFSFAQKKTVDIFILTGQSNAQGWQEISFAHEPKKAGYHPEIFKYTLGGTSLTKADATHLTPVGLIDHGKRIFEAFRILDTNKDAENTGNTLADHWEFVGKAVEEPGYTIWGTSPIMDEDGKVHLFVARWPCALKVDPGWRTYSEIAHYVGNSPEGHSSLF